MMHFDSFLQNSNNKKRKRSRQFFEIAKDFSRFSMRKIQIGKYLNYSNAHKPLNSNVFV